MNKLKLKFEKDERVDVLSKETMKGLLGGMTTGSGAKPCKTVNCSVTKLDEYGQATGESNEGTCRMNKRSDGSILCYCDAYGLQNSGSGNYNKHSHCEIDN